MMKRIVNYKTFINESLIENNLTTEQINFLNRYVIGKWKLNAGAVDVDGAFSCTDKGISDFKGIRFGKITGDFDFSHNNLTSLEGCPKEVGGGFYCNYNKLTSLEGCPERVNAGFYCNYNLLTSLEGCPKGVGGAFGCSDNKLTSLEGCPKEVDGHFDCSYNKLISLEGIPKKVGGSLRCSYNEGLSTKTIGLIFDKIGKSKLDYKTVLKSLWKEISIEDKILLYSSDLDWIEGSEASILSKIKKYSNIKKMI